MNELETVEDKAMAASAEISLNRAAQEVQAAMIVAQKFPRSESRAFQRIMDACKRKSLADAAVYEYERGKNKSGQKNFVTGPSIRLAEVLAQCWGNLDCGIVEVERRSGDSVMMAYCWDLETNYRQTKIFTVPHERHTRDGTRALTDPRDIYEETANHGARRLRKCILGVIPGDIVDSAVSACEKTSEGECDEPISARIRQMSAAFFEIGVTQEMIERFIEHKIDKATPKELTRLRKIYVAIRDGAASPEEYFAAEKPTALAQAIGEKKQGASNDRERPDAPTD